EPHACVRAHAVGVPIFLWEVPRDLLGDIGREPAVTLPHDDVCTIGRIHDVDRMDVAIHLLPDALEHALGAGTLHAYRDARILHLERPRELFRHRQIHRGVEGELALPGGGFD